jgi:hypothetical protein
LSLSAFRSPSPMPPNIVHRHRDCTRYFLTSPKLRGPCCGGQTHRPTRVSFTPSLYRACFAGSETLPAATYEHLERLKDRWIQNGLRPPVSTADQGSIVHRVRYSRTQRARVRDGDHQYASNWTGPRVR